MMKKNNILLIITILGLALGMGQILLAQDQEPTPSPTTTALPQPSVSPEPSFIPPNLRNIPSKDLKQSLSINEIKGRFICKLVGGCPGLEEKGEVEILIKAGQVTGVSANEITVKIFGIEYKVNLTKAKLLNSQWNTGELDNFVVGDLVNVYGFIEENNPFLINAKTVRNLSLQKHLSIFRGVIQNLSNSTFSLLTEKNGTITVVVKDDTKIIRTEKTACIQIYPPVNCPLSASRLITFADLKEGEKAIVRGEYDKNLNQLRAEQILVGDDDRPFFKKQLMIQLQKENGWKEEIKNQIRNLQERIRELREQMKKQPF